MNKSTKSTESTKETNTAKVTKSTTVAKSTKSAKATKSTESTKETKVTKTKVSSKSTKAKNAEKDKIINNIQENLTKITFDYLGYEIDYINMKLMLLIDKFDKLLKTDPDKIGFSYKKLLDKNSRTKDDKIFDVVDSKELETYMTLSLQIPIYYRQEIESMIHRALEIRDTISNSNKSYVSKKIYDDVLSKYNRLVITVNELVKGNSNNENSSS